MINIIIPLIFVILLYISLIFYFKKQNLLLTAQTSKTHDYIDHFLLTIPILLHGGTLYHFIFNTHQEINFSIGYVISGLTWTTLAIYWINSLFSNRLIFLRNWLLTLGAISTSLIFIFPPVKHLAHTELPLFSLHVMIALLGYGLLFLASLFSIFVLFFQRRLKQTNQFQSKSKGGSWLDYLPQSITVLGLEKTLFKLIFSGFGFLTLTLASGIIFSQELFHTAFQLNHKNILSIISWIILFVLIMGRTLKGWRGSTIIHWLLSGFGVLTLGYLGSKFVLEIILNRF